MGSRAKSDFRSLLQIIQAHLLLHRGSRKAAECLQLPECPEITAPFGSLSNWQQGREVKTRIGEIRLTKCLGRYQWSRSHTSFLKATRLHDLLYFSLEDVKRALQFHKQGSTRPSLQVSTRGSSSNGEEGLRTGNTTPGDAEGGQLGLPNCSSQHKEPGASLPCTRATQEDFTRHLLAAVWHLPTALLILNPSGVRQQAKRRAPDTPAARSAPVRSKLAHQPAGYLQEHAPVHGLTEESQKP